ncbi:MAG: sucrose phosphorylase [Acidimicrobiia bacterium]|nr:sucrose phosphorylase [Acidimicrobiia bacterium]
MRNGVQLITYADRFGGGGLAGLHQLLTGRLAGVFTGVHVLPFFEPYDGADAGFDPVDHTRVDPRLGGWGEIAKLAAGLDVTADLIVNHLSDESAEFLDFRSRGDASPYAGLFLTPDKVFGDGTNPSEWAGIYRPRPGAPFTPIEFADGSTRLLWTTFTEHQIDIDLRHPTGRAYLSRILDRFAENGIRQVRLDAVGYAMKTPGTSCFMTPDTSALIEDLSADIHARGMEVLVEIHGHHQQQLDIAPCVDRVYDFALPPLVLHSLHSRSSTALRGWLELSPRNAVTVLDTHDGIGIVDLAAAHGRPGLLADIELDALVETIHTATNGESRRATGAAASNLDLYQVNTTYFAALGYDEHRYLLARLIQFFSPGIPQVYYGGLMAARNDMELLERTGVGRDINRPYLTDEDITERLGRPVVQRLCRLARFRNRHAAFGGRFSVTEPGPGRLSLQWTRGPDRATADLDLNDLTFKVGWSDRKGISVATDWDDLPD